MSLRLLFPGSGDVAQTHIFVCHFPIYVQVFRHGLSQVTKTELGADQNDKPPEVVTCPIERDALEDVY